MMDMERIEKAVREILLAVGENPDREGLVETPERVAKMYAEVFDGLNRNPRIHTEKTFSESASEFVLVKDIPFHSTCEHHLLPVIGQAHVAYIPKDGQVIGLSKLARIVEDFALRPQLQERLTNQVADVLAEELGAEGVFVVLEAEHMCMTLRGIKKPGAKTVTYATRGAYTDRGRRQEVLDMMNL
ncbi:MULTISPECIES: GTP cyclohydrolase I FolE [Lactobacillales]|uniref:GTP cyclohydrolase I FolE n=1 Tax=Lactobacillales TaxID=186826 RepID=UPI00196B2801|nr:MULTISPECIES: GTP cyclohydrolase I FolE [unclassified Carnobacterium]